jgi:hypothetical protein
MMVQKPLLFYTMLLALSGCSTPRNDPSPLTQLPQPYPSAASLRIVSALQTPSRMQFEGVEGSVVSTLVVESDGSVSSAVKPSGSTQVWFYIRPALFKVRFASTALATPAPWLVTVAITTDQLPVSVGSLSFYTVVPKSSVSPQLNGLGSGINQSGRVARMYVVDVQPKRTTTK